MHAEILSLITGGSNMFGEAPNGFNTIDVVLDMEEEWALRRVDPLMFLYRF
jgi:hypothetical protein